MSNPSIPKFGSFKPKSVAQPSEQTSRRSQEERPREKRERSRSRDHDQRRRRDDPKYDRLHRHRESGRDQHRSRHSRSTQRSPSPAPPKDEFEESDLFIVDRRGDKKNVEFGGLHRYSIPAYHRIGSGYILGTHRGERIDRTESTEKAIVLTTRDDLRDKRSIRPLVDQGKSMSKGGRSLKLVLPGLAPGNSDLGRDFVELDGGRGSRKRKRDTDSPDSGFQSVDYRSIEGKAKEPTKPVDADMEFASESDVDEEDAAMAEARNKNAELSRRTKEEPKNASAWLDLAAYQTHLINRSDDPSLLANVEKRTLADIRVSIYERALKHVPADANGHDSLWLGLLNEGTIIWETSKLASKWDGALKANPHSVTLWTKFLDFQQTNPTSVGFTKCKETYIRCLGMLNSADISSGTDTNGNARIDVFLRLTCFMRDAGYDELAYGLWQVVLEYHFFRPSALAQNTTAELDALEEWWEADVPRIGEDGSMGWAHFHANGRNGISRRQVERLPDDLSDSSSSLLVDALRRECRAGAEMHLPAAAEDEDDGLEVGDPFRYIMFSDMRDVVKHMLGELSKRSLISVFFCFMGLPPLSCSPRDKSVNTAWASDQFIQTRVEQLRDMTESPPSVPNNESMQLWNQIWTPFDLFHDDHFLTLSGDISSFNDRILSTITTLMPQDDAIAEYYLAFVLRHHPTEAAKTAKRLLKGRPTSLVLYNAYALAEAKLDHLEKAVGVWKAAIAGDVGGSENEHTGKVLLWHSWMMILLQKSKEDEALGVLVGMAGGGNAVKDVTATRAAEVSAAVRLKVTQHLAEAFEIMLSRNNFVDAVRYVDCLAWFTCLVAERSIDAALPIFAKYVDILALQSAAFNAALELLHQFKAAFIEHHVKHKRAHRPAILRSELISSLVSLPENSMILSALTAVKGQTLIDDRLRDTAHSALAKSEQKEGLIARSHRINEELRRFSIGAATSSSVQATFTSILLDTSSSVKHSTVLWRAWLEFELQQMVHDARSDYKPKSKQAARNTPTDRVKNVFYDGLRHLPWNKHWVVGGLSLLLEAGVLGDVEVQKVLGVAEDRELRMRDWSLASLDE